MKIVRVPGSGGEPWKGVLSKKKQKVKLFRQSCGAFTLPETNSEFTPKNRLVFGPKRKPDRIFRGEMLVSGFGYFKQKNKGQDVWGSPRKRRRIWFLWI